MLVNSRGCAAQHAILIVGNKLVKPPAAIVASTHKQLATVDLKWLSCVDASVSCQSWSWGSVCESACSKSLHRRLHSLSHLVTTTCTCHNFVVLYCTPGWNDTHQPSETNTLVHAAPRNTLYSAGHLRVAALHPGLSSLHDVRINANCLPDGCHATHHNTQRKKTYEAVKWPDHTAQPCCS